MLAGPVWPACFLQPVTQWTTHTYISSRPAALSLLLDLSNLVLVGQSVSIKQHLTQQASCRSIFKSAVVRSLYITIIRYN